ncbi:unnamed protein product [Trichobilharzia regenti]|nr:unnamed protein product [Trichobilharzia regenti]
MLPSVHWTIERVLAAGMLPLYPIAIYMDTPMMNFIVVTAVSIHSGMPSVLKHLRFGLCTLKLVITLV